MRTPRCVVYACILGVTAGAAAPLLAGTGSAATEGPRLVCDEPVFEFGERNSGGTVAHTFVLRNAGRASLLIERVKASCGCTAAQLDDTTLLPGATAGLTTQLSLRGRRGPQRHNIRVYSNDPQRPQLQLWIRGTAVVDVAAHPAFVNLGTMVVDEKKTVRVRLVGRKQQPMIREVRCPAEDVVAHPWQDASGAVGINVVTQPPMKTGALRATVTVVTELAGTNASVVTVPVYGTVKGEIVVIPDEIVLSAASTEPVARMILLRPGSRRDFIVDDVKPPNETITVQIRRRGRGTYQLVIGNLHADDVDTGHTICITTSADRMKTIEIPIRVVP